METLNRPRTIYYNEEVLRNLIQRDLELDIIKTEIDSHVFYSFSINSETFVLSYSKNMKIWTISNGSRSLVSPFTGAHLDYNNRVIRFFNGTVLDNNEEQFNYTISLFKRDLF